MGRAYLRETKAFKKAVKLSAQGKRQMIWMAQIFSVERNKKKKANNLPTHPPLPSTTRGSHKAQTHREQLCTATFLRTGWANKHLPQVFTAELVKSSQTSHPSLEEFAEALTHRAHSSAATEERMALSSQVFPAPLSNLDLSLCHTIVFTARLPYKWCSVTHKNTNTVKGKKKPIFLNRRKAAQCFLLRLPAAGAY